MTRIAKIFLLTSILFNAHFMERAFASADSTLSLSYDIFGGGLNGATGFSLQYQSQQGGKGMVRPTLSGEISEGTGKTGLGSVSLYEGDVGAGLAFLLTKSARLVPFINPSLRLGWASLSTGSSYADKSVGLCYGFNIAGGVILRLKDDSDAMGLLIATSYTLLPTTLSQTGSFSNFQLTVGMTF